MHGISRELLKLARASRAFHKGSEGATEYHDTVEGREVDTEPIYFELLNLLAPKIGLRVVLDVIAGASAGGVNGIMLARALAHDLDIDHQRQMWLKHADVTHLVDEEASPSRWRQIYMAPLTTLLSYAKLRELAPEEETREKLVNFMRSRWFQPPFSGPRFTSWLLDACADMEKKSPEGSSLLPDGHPLDLFVSVTDFYGHANRISLHDPDVIEEREHRHVLRFGYLRSRNGEVRSEFDANMVPGLAFAARATSSFPGAFEPVSIAEIDKVLAGRGEGWSRRDRFLADKIAPISIRPGEDALSEIRFIDGSLVDAGADIDPDVGISACRDRR